MVPLFILSLYIAVLPLCFHSLSNLKVRGGTESLSDHAQTKLQIFRVELFLCALTVCFFYFKLPFDFLCTWLQWRGLTIENLWISCILFIFHTLYDAVLGVYKVSTKTAFQCSPRSINHTNYLSAENQTNICQHSRKLPSLTCLYEHAVLKK